MNISLDHGNSPTLHYVTVGPLELAFSYSTIVAFRSLANGQWYQSENVWSRATGKHLNEIPGSKLDHETFSQYLADMLDTLTYVGEKLSR